MYDKYDDRPSYDDGSHRCEYKSCSGLAEFDDEPYCFDHSPASGSFLMNYSYRKDTFNTGKY